MARTQGTPRLKNTQKARILAKKNAELYGNKKIAQQEGVSLSTVEKIKSETVSPEVLKLADQYSLKIVDNLKNVAMLGVENTLDKIHGLNAKDSMIVAATAIDKVQLLTNNPTSIVGNSDKALAHKLLAKAIQNGADRKEAISYICSLMEIDSNIFE